MRTKPIELSDASVVVVEDNPDNLMLMMDLLEGDCGVKYGASHTSGAQFFTLIEAQPQLEVDLILLDIQIPGEDGYAIIEQIRRTPSLAGALVIAVTANVMPQDIERAKAAGFDGFLGKPLKTRRFPEQIRRILTGEAVWEPR